MSHNDAARKQKQLGLLRIARCSPEHHDLKALTRAANKKTKCLEGCE